MLKYSETPYYEFSYLTALLVIATFGFMVMECSSPILKLAPSKYHIVMSICLPFLPLPPHRPIPSRYKSIISSSNTETSLRTRWILNSYTSLDVEISKNPSYKSQILLALHEIYVLHRPVQAKLALQAALAHDFKAKFESEYLLVSAEILYTARKEEEAKLMFENIVRSSEKDWQVRLYACLGATRCALRRSDKVRMKNS
jgi:hypothetical protein